MRTRLPFQLCLLAVLLSLQPHGQAQPQGTPMKLHLTSAAFANGTTIPTVHTCDGADQSPPLIWSNAPRDTVSFALICDDPDAPLGTWVHWLLWNLPSTATELPEGAEKGHALPAGTIQGTNDFHRLTYGGPCPPRGKAHHYHFKLYALNTALALPSGAKKQELLKAMDGHILAQTEHIGLYQRH